MRLRNLSALISLLHITNLGASYTTEKPYGGTYHVCKSPVCLERANLIKASLNESVDPCDDFYSYACGGWIHNHSIAGDEATHNNFQMLKYFVIKTLKDILENITVDNTNELNFTQKAAVFYNACTAAQGEESLNEMIDTLKASGLEDWPLTSGSTTSKTWTEVLLSAGLSSVLEYRIGRDHFEPSSNVIQMDEVGFTFVGRDQLIFADDNYNQPIISAYKELAGVAMKLINKTLTEENITEIVDKIVEFEGNLANLTTPPEEKTNFTAIYDRTTVGELQSRFPGLPLLELLRKDFSAVNVSITDTETIELFATEYYEMLINYLNYSDSTTFFNYVGLKTVLSMAEYASHEFRDALLEFRNVTEGVEYEAPRWQVCITLMDDIMAPITGFLYVQRQFFSQARTEVEYFVERIRQSFNETLRKSAWLDNYTRDGAVKKLNHMQSKIGYPEWILNITVLDNIYRHVMSPKNDTPFLKIWLTFLNNTWKNELLSLREPYPTDDVWPVGPTAVNAFYDASVNEMVFPAAVLQDIFYHPGLPFSLNFGAIGTFIGHELSHGFDTIGIQLNEYGELDTWISEGNLKAFYELLGCFVDQYGSIRDPDAGMMLDGERTINENIADNSGLRTAFEAYEKLLEEECQNEDTRLEGLEYLSGKQLFFIAYGMAFCSLTRKADLEYDIKVRAHTPDRYRVTVPVSNMEAFSTVFNCTSKASMKPIHENICTLW